jgi:hypothetical protein
MLVNAVRFEDRKEGITIFFFLFMLGRVGLRVGEAIHMTHTWSTRIWSLSTSRRITPMSVGSAGIMQDSSLSRTIWSSKIITFPNESREHCLNAAKKSLSV